MATKRRTTHEMAIDWLSDSLWGELHRQEIKLKKCIIKGGMGDWLCVLSAEKDGERVVGFIGASDLINIALKVKHQVQADEVQWREDKYAK